MCGQVISSAGRGRTAGVVDQDVGAAVQRGVGGAVVDDELPVGVEEGRGIEAALVVGVGLDRAPRLHRRKFFSVAERPC